MKLKTRHADPKPNAFAGGFFAVSTITLAAFSAVVVIVGIPANSLAQANKLDQSRSSLAKSIARREKARANLDSNRKFLRENRQRAGSIQEEMASLKKERANLNADLIRSGAKVKEAEAKLTAVEKRLGKFEQQESDLRASLNTQHRSIGRLLSAIQRMGRNPPPVIVTQRTDALAMVRSAMLLARAFPKLRGEALALSRQLNKLVAVMNGIRRESEQLQAEARTLKEAQTKLTNLMQIKRRSLRERRIEMTEVNRTVTAVGRNVRTLEQLIRRLGPAIARETRIGREIEAQERRKAIAQAEYEAQARTKAQARKLRELQVALNVPKPAIKPKDQKTVIEPVVVRPPAGAAIKPSPDFNLTPNGGAYIGDTARMSPAIPFHRAKGQLPMPAAGSLETRFGEATKFGGRSKGLVIKTRPGAQITAPADGWVVYAGKFRTYGQLLIIKAGNGYHVLLAGMSQIDVQSGQFVLAAEPVGTMKSAPGRKSGVNSPRLYVEFRKNGRPINPRPWWSANSKQRVQG